MFNQNSPADTKIAVLEERLSSYETMMRKIDEAIQIMGKTSQNISRMLAVHEEKIENCSRIDESIEKMIIELKEENKEQHDAVSARINGIEEKIENLIKFRWQVGGVLTVIVVLIGIVDLFVPNVLNKAQPQQVIIERTK